jgi:tetratricopeptide (TPR) repeat protein
MARKARHGRTALRAGSTPHQARSAPAATAQRLADGGQSETVWELIDAGQGDIAQQLCEEYASSGYPADGRMLHAQGFLALARADLAAALAALEASLALDERNARAHYHFGRALRASGALRAALRHYDRSLQIDPSNWEAHTSRGALLRALGRIKDAVKAHGNAIARNPGAVEVHFNLANALFADNQPAAAGASYRQALALKPDHANARRGLRVAQAHALLDAGEWDAARRAHEQLVAEYPEVPALHIGLAIARWSLKDHDGARRALDVAHSLQPGDGAACLHIGTLLNQQGLWEEALHWHALAAERLPGFAPPLIEWGVALLERGRYDEALEKLDAACACAPDLAAGPYNRSFVHLMLGHMAQGYRDFEYRFQHDFAHTIRRPTFAMPTWQGEDLRRRHLLVWTEQGFGDALQFVRYLPKLAAHPLGRLSVRVHAPLERLIRASFPALDVAAELAPLAAPADFECPLMSLPLRLGIEGDCLPGQVPYLRVPEPLRLAWQARLGASPRLRIGLAWSGNPDQSRNHIRSIPLATLAALVRPYAEDGRCEFHVLQKGAGLTELDALPELPVQRSSDHCEDLADTAALMDALDLIITIDTSVAHLAGGLGRPAWILLARVPDWRYGPEAADCAWYPSARLFRQPDHGDWDSLLGEVRRALDALLVARDQGRGGRADDRTASACGDTA